MGRQWRQADRQRKHKGKNQKRHGENGYDREDARSRQKDRQKRPRHREEMDIEEMDIEEILQEAYLAE